MEEVKFFEVTVKYESKTVDQEIIVEEKQVNGGTWGKLKSGIGWINVGPKYIKKV